LLGEKGRVVVKIVTNGISCHASMPSIGKNAIYMMSDIIQNLDDLDEFFPKIEPPLPMNELKELLLAVFPSREQLEKVLSEQPVLTNIIKSLTSFSKSLTMIDGGIKSNVVPDNCESIIDFRLLPNQSTEMVLNALKQLINKLGYEVKNEATGEPEEVFAYLEVIQESEASYWEDWRESVALKDFHDILERIYKEKSLYFLLPASADASFYRNTDYCPSTIIFGPGNAATAHAIDESMEIQDYIKAIKVYTIFAYHFLS
jgi:succinyl-diaminopimelate desuccinylase